MENRNNRDFEQFVQQNADQYRMFPSENVWKGIHSSLHTRRRWYGIGLGLLLLSTVVTVTLVMMPSNKNNKNNTPPAATAKEQPILAEQRSAVPTAELPLVANIQPTPNPALTNNHTTPVFALPEIERSLLGHSASVFTPILSRQVETIAPATATVELKNEIIQQVNPAPMDIRIIDQATDNTYSQPIDPRLSIDPSASKTENPHTIAAGPLDLNPLSIESIVNAYRHPVLRRRLSWEIYFVPTISYRRLTENRSFLSSPQSNNSPYSYAALHDVNSAVTHKPDMGMEFGFMTGYPLSKNIKLLGGLQFNVSKYDIRAYVHTSEVTTIALSSGAAGNNSVSAVTSYRNFDGYHTDWLHTLYVSISAPLGAELKLGGSSNSYWGISGTLQPTYILRDRAYLISTDYKNYAKVPSLIRKWNINSSFEAFAGYSTGKIKWKIGPQVRYQILSSFEEKYPVREHLFDFGLKVGIMLNN